MSVAIFNPQGAQAIGLIPRAARITLRMPLVFTSSEGRVAGHSADVSISGILGAFHQPLDVWLTGQLAIVTPQGRSILVQGRVVRVDGYRAAISFLALTAHARATLLVAIHEAGGSDELVLPSMDPRPKRVTESNPQQDECLPSMATSL